MTKKVTLKWGKKKKKILQDTIYTYSKTSEQQPVLGTDRLTLVERVASLRGFLEYYAKQQW